MVGTRTRRRWWALATAACCFAPPASLIAAREPSLPPYQNVDLSMEARAADLVSRMTLEEKVAQMMSGAPAIPRLGIPAYNWWNEALHGVANGHATVFPQAIGLAATFDPDLVRRIADVISTEARAKHHDAERRGKAVRPSIQPDDIGLTFWSPNINIFRDPRWGRGQETFGEDPYLSGQLGIAFVRGLQGDDPRYLKVVATPKHYAVHSGPELARHTFDARVDEYDLRNTYLPAFQTAVTEGRAASVMCVYNAVQGVPGCASTKLLTDRLRRDWRFGGYIVSDCGAVGNIFKTHGYAKTMGAGAVAAVRAGVDLDCGTEYETLVAEVRSGSIAEAEIDRAVQRLFVARMRLGMFDPPARVPYASIPITVNDSPSHRRLALEAAEKAVVLLKNDGVLPLSKTVRRIAVLGPSADDPKALLGNYNGYSTRHVTPLDGIRRQFAQADVRYALGAGYTASTLTPVSAALLSAPKGDRPLDGVRVEYFGNYNLVGTPGLVRRELRISFDHRGSDAAVLAALGSGKYSIRWTATFTPPSDGDYLLAAGPYLWSSGGKVRLLVDGRAVGSQTSSSTISLPGAQTGSAIPSGGTEARLTLEGGRRYAISVELRQDGRDGTADLFMIPPQEATLREAEKLVRGSDVAIIFAGLNAGLEGEELRNVNIPGFEGGDRTSIDLPEPQERLIRNTIATGIPVIVVLTSGSALSVNHAAERASAVIAGWYGGEEAGTAIAKTLTGLNNPAGRLPVTFYKGVDQLPAFTDYAMRRRTYRYFKGTPLYPFGYGLSYSRFAYSQLTMRRQQGSHATVSVVVRNTSARAGDEVVQLYIAGIGREVRSLRGMRRIHLAAGASQRVTFALNGLPPTKVNISVGAGQPIGDVPHVSGTLQSSAFGKPN